MSLKINIANWNLKKKILVMIFCLLGFFLVGLWPWSCFGLCCCSLDYNISCNFKAAMSFSCHVSQPRFSTRILLMSLYLQPPSKKCTSSFWLKRILCVRKRIKVAPNVQLSVECKHCSAVCCPRHDATSSLWGWNCSHGASFCFISNNSASAEWLCKHVTQSVSITSSAAPSRLHSLSWGDGSTLSSAASCVRLSTHLVFE